jgi:uncharacterized protein DUF2252
MVRAMAGFRASIRDYESWMRAQLGDAFVARDLKEKHKVMRKELFSFLRGTCWRWAETAPAICPELMDAPPVASVVDAHVGNFGLWRDADGRLAWGVNDYDEACVTPWPLDLVRLAASALIAGGAGGRGAAATAAAVHDGYREGLVRPRACILELDRPWLRDLFAASDGKRAQFWDALFAAKRRKQPPPAPFAAALSAALPEPGLAPRIAPRRAGVGSLGRLRLVASLEDYRGGPLAREAKAVLPSCWDRDAAPGALYSLAFGRYRSPDPWLRPLGEVVVRRLGANSRKLDLADHGPAVRRRALSAMATDIASIHAADADRIAAVHEDFARRGAGWLRDAALAVAEATRREWKEYRSK